MVATRTFWLLAACSFVVLLSQSGSTDDFVMKDGTVMEGVLKSYDPRSKELVIQIDEKGTTKRIKERNIRQVRGCNTSVSIALESRESAACEQPARNLFPADCPHDKPCNPSWRRGAANPQ